MQTIVPALGDGVVAALQSPQPPSIESILTVLLNELTAVSTPSSLSTMITTGLTPPPLTMPSPFFWNTCRPQIHIVITTREDPSLPLARYRVQGHFTLWSRITYHASGAVNPLNS
ncbi:MAG: hypothetical protein IPJ94_03695 [Chloroflexi bacterium]|nr:hypothetical protein [Chloroflexota bacterium]